MILENRIPSHPGVILRQEFLAPLGISQVAFAAHLGVPVQRKNSLESEVLKVKPGCRLQDG